MDEVTKEFNKANEMLKKKRNYFKKITDAHFKSLPDKEHDDETTSTILNLRKENGDKKDYLLVVYN